MIFLALKTARVPDLEISGEVQITDLHNPLRVGKGHNCDVAKRWCWPAVFHRSLCLSSHICMLPSKRQVGTIQLNFFFYCSWIGNNVQWTSPGNMTELMTLMYKKGVTSSLQKNNFLISRKNKHFLSLEIGYKHPKQTLPAHVFIVYTFIIIN